MPLARSLSSGGLDPDFDDYVSAWDDSTVYEVSPGEQQALTLIGFDVPSDVNWASRALSSGRHGFMIRRDGLYRIIVGLSVVDGPPQGSWRLYVVVDNPWGGDTMPYSYEPEWRGAFPWGEDFATFSNFGYMPAGAFISVHSFSQTSNEVMATPESAFIDYLELAIEKHG